MSKPRYPRYGPLLPMMGGSDSPAPTTTPGDAPAGPPPAPAPTTPPPAASDTRTFSHGEVEDIVRRRLADEQRKADEKAKKLEADAEAKRLADQQQFKELADKHAGRVKELEADVEGRTARERAMVLEYEIRLAAHALGIVDPDAAYALLDRGKVEFTDAGKPSNLEPLLKALLEAKPYLKGTTATVGTGIPATPRATSVTETAEQRVQRMQQRLTQTGAYDRL